ncbi:VOC family protein [Mesorhizobium sp. ArgA1]
MKENEMHIQGVYAALTTKDMKRAEQFYSILFGREPDDRPMDNLIQWRDVAGANIQLFRDETSAGHGRCTIVVPQMSVARQELALAGLSIRDEKAGEFGRIAQLNDPDGNLITLAEPPSK